MSANFTPDQKGYKTYQSFGTFRLFVLENFPFIAEDFDALTYYQMLCKIVGYLKDVITNNESLQYNQTELLDAFNELQSYVNNYFENLDVQEEINNKLDQMAQDGTLQKIISEYLKTKAIIGFDTVSDMKNSENLAENSYARTFGFYTLNDGGGALYKIHKKEDDVITDEMFTISIGTDLYAELILNSHINILKIGAKPNIDFDNSACINSAINYAIKNNLTIYIPIGKFQINSSLIINNNITIEGEDSNFAEYKGNFDSLNGGSVIYLKSDTPTYLINSLNRYTVTFKNIRFEGCSSSSDTNYQKHYFISWTTEPR